MKRMTLGACVLALLVLPPMASCFAGGGVQTGQTTRLTASDLPPTLLASVGQLIGGDPSQWWIVESKRYQTNGEIVVFLVGENWKSYTVCIDTNRQWVSLSRETELKRISGMLKRRFGETVAIYQGERLLEFLEEFLFLRRGLEGVVASKSFGERESAGFCSWMAGKETNRAVFLNYCTDPAVKTQGQEVEIQFNFFNPWGGVERWNLRGRFTGFLDITNAVGNVLKENGTFYYPLER